MSAHTPGPWRIEGDRLNRGGGYWIAADITDAEEGPEPFEVIVCGRGEWPHRAEMSEANARLITAAPDLKEAAIEALDILFTAPCFCSGQFVCSRCQVADMLRAAISKAEPRDGAAQGEGATNVSRTLGVGAD